MKIIFKTILVSLILSTGVIAETFTEALQKAFKNNSELNAERENLNVSEEDLKVSRSNYLPSVTLSGSKSQVDTNKLTNQSGSDAAISDTDPTTKSLTITQTLVDFGRGADYEKKTIGIDVAKAKLLKKEQDILYSTVEAYTGLILANEKLNINRANVNLLERQVETDQIKLERGQNTLSDVAQSESSLAGARAKLIQAENDFLTSKLNYENIIGPLADPETLEKKSIFDINLPTDLNSAINKSKLTNPDLIIAQLEYEQSTKDTYEAKSDLAPSATLSLDRTYTDDLSSTYDERERDTIKATVSWPFYSGGKNFATIRKSKSLETQKKLLLEDMIKRNETLVASAWSSYQSNKSLLNSVQSQVRAAEIANEGIVAEYNSGSGRTTLDVIQSNALLLNAQISLADSERNYILSQFNLLKSIGLLDSNYLNIN
ncbi:TolC family outer membrane protein [Candidatus Pelagibacter sp.]|uniref:TolC family outer membrane protein n=1 Tax=Candidatus Pelagibacter sp. TaxID=2024849 RepID=UPI003F83A96E